MATPFSLDMAAARPKEIGIPVDTDGFICPVYGEDEEASAPLFITREAAEAFVSAWPEDDDPIRVLWYPVDDDNVKAVFAKFLSEKVHHVNVNAGEDTGPFVTEVPITAFVAWVITPPMVWAVHGRNMFPYSQGHDFFVLYVNGQPGIAELHVEGLGAVRCMTLLSDPDKIRDFSQILIPAMARSWPPDITMEWRRFADPDDLAALVLKEKCLCQFDGVSPDGKQRELLATPEDFADWVMRTAPRRPASSSPS